MHPTDSNARSDHRPSRQLSSRPTPWSLVRDRASALDVALLAVVPAVLLAVYALPTATKRALALEYSSPTLLTAFASHFVHLSPTHLLVNLGGYVLVVSTAYLLSVASGRRRRFFVVFTTFLLAFPFALSGLNLVFTRPTAGIGFSGVVLAFVGYLALALVEFVGQHLRVPVDRERSNWLFFFALALVAYAAIPGVYGAALTLAAALAGVLFLLPVAADLSRAHVDAARGTLFVAGYAELTALGGLVFVGYLVVAFPPTLTTGAGTLNIYTHALGFSLGYVVTYLTVLLGIDVE